MTDDKKDPSTDSTSSQQASSGQGEEEKAAPEGETKKEEEKPEEKKEEKAEEAKPEPEAKAEPKPADSADKPEAKPSSAKAPADAEAKADKPAREEEPKKKPSKKLTGDLKKIAEQIEKLTALELADLASYLEDKFGVSAMTVAGYQPAPGGAAAGGASADGSGASGDKEEKATMTVVLAEAGGNKLGVIKALREFRQDLGLMDAKKLVESAPQEVLKDAKREDADEAKKKLEGAGAKVQLK